MNFKKIKDIASFIIAGIIVLTLIGGIAFGGYWLKRTVNYSLMYEDMVQQTVREMVKEECLKK